MTRLDILDIAKEAATQKLEAAEVKVEAVVEARQAEYKAVIDTFFEGAFEETDNVEVSNNYSDEVVVRVNRPQEGRMNEILSFRFNRKYEEVDFSTIETNFYSTNSQSRFELERMRTLGVVGTTLLDFGDDILAGLNTVKGRFIEEYKALKDEYYTATKALREVDQMIAQVKKENQEEKLMNEGIEFTFDEGSSWNNAQFEIKFDRTLYGVKKIKLVEKTASGKSAKVSITQCFTRWNQEEQKTEFFDKTFVETVRMDKVESFLSQNRKFIMA